MDGDANTTEFAFVQSCTWVQNKIRPHQLKIQLGVYANSSRDFDNDLEAEAGTGAARHVDRKCTCNV